jgi:hypothetical protein
LISQQPLPFEDSFVPLLIILLYAAHCNRVCVAVSAILPLEPPIVKPNNNKSANTCMHAYWGCSSMLLLLFWFSLRSLASTLLSYLTPK